jgi:signal transduction histidine kinase
MGIWRFRTAETDMNSVSPDSGLLGGQDVVLEAPRSAASPVKLRTATWPLPVILTIFWFYVTASNVLFAASMSAATDPDGSRQLYAAWDTRILQHVMLYPVLMVCVWLSLKINWRPLWKTLPLQILLGLFFSVLAGPFLWVSEWLLGHKMPEHQEPSMMSMMSEVPTWVASMTQFVLTYGFALALATGVAFYRRLKDAELRFTALECAWSDARLAALRMQLSPHTLFNLLHTIRGQITWDPAAAQSMIVQLGDLLRRLLSAGERDFVLLRQELEFVQLYLNLQRVRFADRLTIVLPDGDAAPNVWVPSLILQPLIENAVTHGLADHAGPVKIEVEVEQSAESLVLRVINTTAGTEPPRRQGIGLHNVRERLAVHFGPRAAFDAGPQPRNLWRAELRIPVLAEAPQHEPTSWASAAA